MGVNVNSTVHTYLLAPPPPNSRLCSCDSKLCSILFLQEAWVLYRLTPQVPHNKLQNSEKPLGPRTEKDVLLRVPKVLLT